MKSSLADSQSDPLTYYYLHHIDPNTSTCLCLSTLVSACDLESKIAFKLGLKLPQSSSLSLTLPNSQQYWSKTSFLLPSELMINTNIRVGPSSKNMWSTASQNIGLTEAGQMSGIKPHVNSKKKIALAQKNSDSSTVIKVILKLRDFI